MYVLPLYQVANYPISQVSCHKSRPTECAKTDANVTTIKDEDGLTPLIKLVATTNPKLLVNVSLALGRCAQDKETLIKIHELDGVRLIWSMLKNPSEEVRP